MSTINRIWKALQLSGFLYLCANLLYFAVYMLLFLKEYGEIGAVLAGGPNAKFLILLGVLLLLCLFFVFVLRHDRPYGAAMRYLGTAGVFFSGLSAFFVLLHYAYIDFTGAEKAVTDYVLLNSTSFRLLGPLLFFSLLLPLLNLLLHAHTVKLALRFVLHGALLLFVIIAFNLVFFNGFKTAADALVFVVIAVLLYAVFALSYAALSGRRAVQREKEYKNVYKKK